MEITLSHSDLQDAPDEVLHWLICRGRTIEPAPFLRDPAPNWADATLDGFAETLAEAKPKAAPTTKPATAESIVEAGVEIPQANDTPPDLFGEPDPPNMNDVLKAAVAFMEARGEGELQAVLKKVGVARVRECPPEKLAALLAEISVL